MFIGTIYLHVLMRLNGLLNTGSDRFMQDGHDRYIKVHKNRRCINAFIANAKG